MILQKFRLFAASPKYERISALQPDDDASLASKPDEQFVDLALRQRMPVFSLSGQMKTTLRRSNLKQVRMYQPVIYDVIRARQAF
jgi:hypothetical protein